MRWIERAVSIVARGLHKGLNLPECAAKSFRLETIARRSHRRSLLPRKTCDELRRFSDISSDMLVGVCGMVAIAGAVAHFLFEETVWPAQPQLLAVVLLGIGPVGLACLAWDHATKHGNMPLLGGLSYLAPLISSMILIAKGQTSASIRVALSAVLIVGGVLLASLRPKTSNNS